MKKVLYLVASMMMFITIGLSAEVTHNGYSRTADLASLSEDQGNRIFSEDLENKDYMEDMPLLLSYSIDLEEEKVVLSWNKSFDGKKVYVYKKSDGRKFDLITPGGVKGNSYEESLLSWDTSYFVSSIIIPIDRDNSTCNVVSNKVYIQPERTLVRSPELEHFETGDEEGASLAWKNDEQVDRYVVYRYSSDGTSGVDEISDLNYLDSSYAKGGDNSYFVWAINQNGNVSLPLIHTGGGKKSDVAGIYNIDDNKNSVVYKENLTIQIGPESVNEGSVVMVSPVYGIKGSAVNVTAGDITGYRAMLDGNDSNEFLKPVQISMKYDEEKLPEGLGEDNIFIYYRDVKSEQWKTFKRTALDKENNIVYAESTHFCEFYAGVMDIQSEPPQAKGINTKPFSIDSADPMVGIKGITPPTANIQGSANVSYPIEVPAGINGLTPTVSINYNSETKWGNCGVGWNLGMSSIEIKTQNLGVPKYDESEIFLLDGAELVPVGDNTYRFKVEGAFWKIIKEDDGSFKVLQPDGTTMSYGLENTERLFDPVNPDHVFKWYLSSIKDKSDNEIKYEYSEVTDIDTGERVNVQLDRITYGYNDLYSINYSWEDRPDIKLSYISGFKINRTSRLKSITSSYNSNAIKKEVLIFDPNIDKRSVISGIQEIIIKSSKETITNEIAFEYELFNDTDYKGGFEDSEGDGLINEAYAFYWNDYNGDGKCDVITWNKDSNKNFSVYITQADGTLIKKWTGGGSSVLNTQFFFNDFNGDNKCDYAYWNPGVENGNLQIYLAQDDYSFKQVWTGGGSGVSNTEFYWYDYNNDGMCDYSFWNPSLENGQLVVWLAQSDGSFIRNWTGSGFADSETKFYWYDFNGDSLLDHIVWNYKLNDGKFILYLNQGDGSFEKTWSGIGSSGKSRKFEWFDFNGDGMHDFLTWDDSEANGGFIVYLATGEIDNWFKHTWTGGGSGSSETTFEWNDYNGDGLIDYIYWNYRAEDGSFVTYLNQGDGSFIRSWKGAGSSGLSRIFYWNDYNGDGMHDFITWDPNEAGGKFLIYLAEGDGDFEHVSTSGHRFPGTDEKNWKDINGNGFCDSVQLITYGSNITPLSQIYKNSNNSDFKPTAFYLKKITNKKTLAFTTLKTDRQYIPGYKIIPILASVTSGSGNFSLTTNFEYENGIYDRLEKEFRGFETVRSKFTYTNDSSIDNTRNVVTNITENIYKVNDTTGDKIAGMDVFDPYLRGLLASTESRVEILSDSTTTSYITGRTDYSYKKENILTDCDDVQFVYSDETKTGVFDINEGNTKKIDDIISRQAYTFDEINGLVSKITNINPGDPNHTLDDTKGSVYFRSNTVDSNWLNFPVKKIQSDENGNKLGETSYFYDDRDDDYLSAGFLTKEVVWDGNLENRYPINPWKSYEYDKLGNVVVVTDINGTVKTELNILGGDTIFAEITTTANGGTEVETTSSTRIDPYGRAINTTDSLGNISSVQYDDYGRILKVKETVNGSELETKINTYDRIVADGKNIFSVKTESYDPEQTGVDKYFVVETYVDVQNRKSQVKKRSIVNGDPVWVMSPAIERDSIGRAKIQGVPTQSLNDGYEDNSMESFNTTDDLGINTRTKYFYDDFGRNIKVQYPEKSYEVYISTKVEVESAIDLNGAEYQRIIVITTLTDNDPFFLNKEEIRYTDLAGVAVKTKTRKKDDTYIQCGTQYDLSGFSRMTGPEDEISEKQVDNLGRIQWMTTPDAGKTVYEYNEKGQPYKIYEYGTESTMPRETTLLYDQFNRIIEIDGEGTEDDIEYIYYDNSPTGDKKYNRLNIQKVLKGNGFSVEYDYGELSLSKTKTIDGNEYTTGYQYDLQGRIKTLTYPDGESVVYTYDDGGLLKSVGEYITGIEYNKYGQRTEVLYGNGTVTNYEYNPVTALMTKMKQKDSAGTEILSYSYGFDVTGRLESLTDSTGGSTKSEQIYEYDMLGRLVAGRGRYIDKEELEEENKEITYQRDFTFDDANRMMTKSIEDDNVYAFTYKDGTHAVDLINVTNRINPALEKTIDYDYDRFGNMIQKQTSTGSTIQETHDFSYDSGNNIKRIDMGSGEYLGFSYDAGGQRISKTYGDNAVSQIYKRVYVNGFYDENITSSGTDRNRHISDGQYIVASINNNDSDSIIYYTQNNIGSTVNTTNKDGLIDSEYLYTPYGESWVTKENVEIERKFTGQVMDKESGLYYYNARYYDPDTARFLTPDPAMDGVNHYTYVNGNPIKYNDPTGLWKSKEERESARELRRMNREARKDARRSRGTKDTSGSARGGSGSKTNAEIAEAKSQEMLNLTLSGAFILNYEISGIGQSSMSTVNACGLIGGGGHFYNYEESVTTSDGELTYIISFKYRVVNDTLKLKNNSYEVDVLFSEDKKVPGSGILGTPIFAKTFRESYVFISKTDPDDKRFSITGGKLTLNITGKVYEKILAAHNNSISGSVEKKGVGVSFNLGGKGSQNERIPFGNTYVGKRTSEILIDLSLKSKWEYPKILEYKKY